MRQGTSGSYTRIATLAANTTTYVDTTAVANTSYTYRIRAYSTAGTSSASNTVTVRTPVAATTPAPTGTNGQLTAAGQSTLQTTTGETTHTRSCRDDDDAVESVYRGLGEQDDFWSAMFG